MEWSHWYHNKESVSDPLLRWSCPTHIREQCYKTLLTDVITDGYPVWQPCCRSCIGIHSNNDELAAWSWCCTESGTTTTTTTTTTESKMVLSSYPLQVTLNQFPSAYSQTFFPSAIRLRNTLPVDSFKTHLNSFRFIWAPDYVPFLSSAVQFLSEVTVYCLLHGFLDTHLLIHLLCYTARIRVGTVIGRWRWSPAPGDNSQRSQRILHNKPKYNISILNWNLPTLKYRRLRGDMIEVFKITHNIYDRTVSPDLPRNES